jgi:hypothetical protein
LLHDRILPQIIMPALDKLPYSAPMRINELHDFGFIYTARKRDVL